MPNILIDLDGTIHDPGPGIIGSVQTALTGLKLPVPPAADLGWVIGPPLRTSFPRLGVPLGDIEAALELYREHYRAGAMYDAVVYDGIPEVLDRLRGERHRLFVATSKPHVFARPILERFGLAGRFVAIHGSELDGRNDDKADLIAMICAKHGLAPADTIMIGDRRYDILGAARNQLKCVGVLWGYGTRDELAAAGAAAIVTAPADLPATIARLLAN